MASAEPGALEGLRVLDLTRILGGPLCTMMLGDMGAEVIKVEPPGTGDDTRTWGPPFAGGESAYFLGVNRNKRSILAALNGRHRTGRGQHVEVSLFDSGLAMLANVASNHLISGREAGRFGNGHPNIVPYTAYSVKDGMIAVAVGNDAQFARFSAALGKPEWAGDARFVKNPDRVTNRELLDGMIADVLRPDTAQAWLTKLTAAGIPCGRINSVSQALSDPHTLAREMVRTVKHPAAGEVKVLGIPFRFSHTPAAIHRAPPTLGEQTEEVLRDELGLSAERVAQLRAEKVI